MKQIDYSKASCINIQPVQFLLSIEKQKNTYKLKECVKKVNMEMVEMNGKDWDK